MAHGRATEGTLSEQLHTFNEGGEMSEEESGRVQGEVYHAKTFLHNICSMAVSKLMKCCVSDL